MMNFSKPSHYPPYSGTFNSSDHDRNIILEDDRKNKLVGQGDEQLFPDATKIKLEPIDPGDEISSTDNATAVLPFDQIAIQQSVQDVMKLHKDSAKDIHTGVAVIKKSWKSPVVKKAQPKRCSVCSKAFSHSVLLIRHLKWHKTKLKTRRLWSVQKFCRQNNTLKRQLTYTIKNNFSALRKLFRNSHVQNRSKSQVGALSSSSACFVCQKWFNYKAVFRLHMLRTHTALGVGVQRNVYDNSSYSIPSASTENCVGNTIVNIQNSVKSRTTKEKKYKCPLCDKSFTQSGKLSSHKKKHTGEKPFHCSVCGKDFALKDHLNIHIKIHTGERPYQCTLCDKSFRQGGHLRVHMQTHTGIKPYKCDVCNKEFSQKGSLTSHMRTHTGEKLQHQCTLCDKSFRDSTKLNNHVRTHTGEKPFQCSLCNKAFSQSGDLVRHMRTHTGEKPYVCTVCNKQFSEGSNLNKHMRTHTGYKPHECSICHKSFSEGSTLKNHMRIHSGEKPYQCSICKKEFIQSGDLYKHMRTHTGEKPHNCPICGRAFTESSTLKKHMKIHKQDNGEVVADFIGRSQGYLNSSSGSDRSSLQPKFI